jgi:hypothetical protein
MAARQRGQETGPEEQRKDLGSARDASPLKLGPGDNVQDGGQV